jgi:hypothetical protein
MQVSPTASTFTRFSVAATVGCGSARIKGWQADQLPGTRRQAHFCAL